MELNLSRPMRRRTTASSAAVVALMAALLLAVVPEVISTRYIVGSGLGEWTGWSPYMNYTAWPKDKHFYNGDWLFFVYDRNKQNVLEVNKTDYETCNSDHPLHNWTAGVGRDVVPLSQTRTYYFISGNGYCHTGMKLEIKVEDSPLIPPASSPSPGKRGSYVGSPTLPPASSPEKSDSYVGNPTLPPASSPEKSDSYVGNPTLPPASSSEKSDSYVGNPTLPPASWQMITDSYVGNPTIYSPASSPEKSDSSSLRSSFKGQIFVPILFAVAVFFFFFFALIN